jgi:hypothetical protein
MGVLNFRVGVVTLSDPDFDALRIGKRMNYVNRLEHIEHVLF